MMLDHLVFTFFLVALFFVLTPGVLVSIPKNASCKTRAAVHALVFGVIYQLTHQFVWKRLYPNN